MNYKIKSNSKYRVIKKFTLLPLRIYQHTSLTTWWSWLETTYIFQCFEHANNNDKLSAQIKSFFFGGYWKNIRITNINEFNTYNKIKCDQCNEGGNSKTN